MDIELKSREEDFIQLLRQYLPKLLREKPEFKHEVAGILSESFPTREEMGEILEEIRAMRKAFEKRFDEHSKILQEHSGILQEYSKILQEHSNRIEELVTEIKGLKIEVLLLKESFESLKRSVDAIGARWGVLSESAFRNAMAALLEKRFGYKVEKWRYFDKDGKVYFHPCEVEVDLAIHNEQHILIEIKSSVSFNDISAFIRIASLYKEITGIEPRKVMVSPYIEGKALDLAYRSMVEIYTAP